MKLKDLTGMRFSRLTVIGRAPDYVSPTGKHLTCWTCICDCGRTIDVTSSHLKNGHTHSCGCYNREQAILRTRDENSTSCVKRKTNRYEFKDEKAYCHFNNGGGFSFDSEDYDKLKDYCWYNNGYGYAVAHDSGRKQIFAHRVVTDCPSDKVVDHINHDTLDNQKQNLRACTQEENMKNIRPRRANTSGITGVWFEKSSNRWRASIRHNRRTMHLGSYHTAEEAREARKRAEKDFYGDFAYKE